MVNWGNCKLWVCKLWLVTCLAAFVSPHLGYLLWNHAVRIFERCLHKSISHQGSQVRAGFTEPSVLKSLLSHHVCWGGFCAFWPHLSWMGWGQCLCTVRVLAAQCWPRTCHVYAQGARMSPRHRPAAHRTQQSYRGSLLPAAPVLHRWKPDSCPGVNVLIGNKWVFPNFGTKIVQSLWSLLIIRFLVFLGTSAGLSLLSYFGFAVFWQLLRAPSLWTVVLLLFQERTRHSAPKRNT